MAGSARIGALAALGLVVLPACTSHQVGPSGYPGLPKASDVALVRYSTCGQALRNLRAAATAAVSRGEVGVGYATSTGTGSGAPRAAGAPAAPGAGISGSAIAGSGTAGQPSAGSAPGYYSGTNDAVAGVDEPDLIKTDGQRIVTVIGGVLRVVDARTHQVTGALDLSTRLGLYGATAANLLLSSDHALILLNSFYPVMGPMAVAVGGTGSGAVPGTGSAGAPGGSPAWGPIAGPRLLLVDLSTGTPRIISEYTMDGSLVDARQVGAIARVVVRSAPRLFYEPGQVGGGVGASTANRSAIDRAGISAWLPRFALIDGGARRTGRVGCADVSHPAVASYSGTSMLTVLTFDLRNDSLGDGQPVTIVADGQTVYSNGASLYVANDQQWITPPTGVAPGAERGEPPVAVPATSASAMPGSAPATPATAAPATTAPVTATPAQPSSVTPTATEQPAPALPAQYVGLYKFSIAGPGRPVYEASGTVPGWLLSSTGMTQYALSEWDGALRVATTTGNTFGYYSQPQSAVYELEQVGNQLVIVGKVGGLGAGEQIYAVRFAGPVGYVVTFRQVDPLYTLDLSDPAQPRVAGELLLSGYSAYLDPIDAAHVIGVGQNANALGEALGTQVSLFDVSDLTAPVRQAVYYLRFGHSEAEFDPHAFLYWPASRIVVIPVQLPYVVTPVPSPQPGSPSASPPTSPPVAAWPASGALVLHVGDHSIAKLGMIRQPAVPGWPGGGQVLRSLVIGNELWTLSDAGLQANDLTTLAPAAWVPFG